MAVYQFKANGNKNSQYCLGNTQFPFTPSPWHSALSAVRQENSVHYALGTQVLCVTEISTAPGAI